MKVVHMLAAADLALSLPVGAYAEKQMHWVTASSADLKVQAEREKDGTVLFTVTRDPRASRYSGRSAYLRVGGLERTPQEEAASPPAAKANTAGSAKKVLVSCTVEGEVTPRGIVYGFGLDPGVAAQAELRLWEIDPDPEVLGGGDIYHIRLKHFLPAAVENRSR